MHIKKLLSYFSTFEKCLWLGSISVITISFLLSGNFHVLTLIASLVGVSALIFLAKGNVIGQFLIIVFSVLYGVVSWEFKYYGELNTYVFMTLPTAAIAAVTWLKNPSKKGRSEVAVGTMTKTKLTFLFTSAIFATILFYFILDFFHTANLPLSTLSVTTSYLASMLTVFRGPYYALAYAANDVVLIGLWVLASITFISYLPMVFCFIAFLINDLYGFISWRRMERRQLSGD
ncbi:MAG: nicotinamide mononucleotide transporter [Clostridia bacterium]|nr:nicotinamide mononucleotide transporter [Clostridia bacterium]